MEGRCQYTVFFSAALNLQNIQITDKKLSPISPSFNPCGPCGPQRLPGLHHRGPRRISILAVLADRDHSQTTFQSILGDISILAVLADCDTRWRDNGGGTSVFQSSRSLRTATRKSPERTCRGKYFNPRGPCGPRLRYCCKPMSVFYFNPRGPCGPRREPSASSLAYPHNFNPRGPCGPRPKNGGENYGIYHFNPRSPCGPRRNVRTLLRTGKAYFNPRGPCGPRPYAAPIVTHDVAFQSSRSLRTATRNHRK